MKLHSISFSFLCVYFARLQDARLIKRQQKQAYTCDRVQTAATEAGLHLWPCANSGNRSRLTPVTVCKQRQQKQAYTCDHVQTAATEAGLHLWPCANSDNRSRLTPVTVCKQRQQKQDYTCDRVQTATTGLDSQQSWNNLPDARTCHRLFGHNTGQQLPSPRHRSAL